MHDGIFKYVLFAAGVLLVLMVFTDTKINLPIPTSFNPSSPLPNPDVGKPVPANTGDSSYT